jgi:GT2 family glycosyltransferase
LKSLNSPKVSVVILNYNAGKLLEKCIRSVLQSDYKNLEVILVDNASQDESQKKCKEKFPEIKLLENEENFGYCEGNNKGLEKITGEFVIILNPDTEVESNWINEFQKEYKKYGEGLYQPKLLAVDDKTRINSGGNMMNIFGFGYSSGKGKKDSKEYSNFKSINYASGACLFTSTKTLNKIGFFDSYLFAYHDDLELGWRAQQIGIKSFYVPSSVVYHAESFSFKWSPKKFYLLERNRWYCILTHYSKSTFYKILPSLIIIEIMIFFYFLSKGMIKEKFKASRDILKDRKIIREKFKEIESKKKISDKEIIANFANHIEIPPEISSTSSLVVFNKIIYYLGKISKKII